MTTLQALAVEEEQDADRKPLGPVALPPTLPIDSARRGAVLARRALLICALGPGNYHELARRSGVSWTHVSRVLRGKIGVRMQTLQRIADAAGVTVADVDEYIRYQRCGPPVYI